MDIDSQPLCISWLSEKKYVYLVVNVCTKYYMYAVYRIEMSEIVSSSGFNRPIYWLDEPLLLLGREFPAGMGFFSFGSRIYMLGSSKGEIEYRSRSVHVFDTVTCDLGSAAYDQQMQTEKHRPVVIQPLKPFDDRVFVFSGDGCGEDLEVFYPECQIKSWTLLGGPPGITFPPDCRAERHSTVSDGFVLLSTNMVILLYNIPLGTWTVVEDQSYTTCLLLEPSVFAYEIGKWFSFRGSFLCSYFVDSKGIHEFGIYPHHLCLLDDPHCQFRDKYYPLYLGSHCFCVVRSGYDRPAGSRQHPNDPFPSHHAMVTLFHIDSSANLILDERSSSYEIISLEPCKDTDSAFVCACFVI